MLHSEMCRFLCVYTDVTAVGEHLALTNDLPSIFPDTADNIPSITLYGHFQEAEGRGEGRGMLQSAVAMKLLNMLC